VDVIVIVIVDVIVDAPVILAVHVNGNATVIVIENVDQRPFPACTHIPHEAHRP
jgi:hypothetical protein